MQIKFISNNHYRTENGIRSNKGNEGAFRGIIIEPQGDNFIVSIELLEPPFYSFEGNYQMTPKPMSIIKEEPGTIYFRGKGEFSDYGINMEVEEAYIKQITLVLYNRNIEITYLNGEGNKNIDPIKEAVRKIIDLFITNYNQEDRDSTVLEKEIIKAFAGQISQKEVEIFIHTINNKCGREVIKFRRAIDKSKVDQYFSIFSSSVYVNAYMIEASLSYISSIKDKF